MRVLLVGVSCVGKTTIGAALSRRLEVPFFDLDTEIERHFGLPIERLQSLCLNGYSHRKDCSVVLERIVVDNPDCVVATVPSGLRDAYLRVVRKVPCVTVAIHDRPENILKRITFYDLDSRPIGTRLSDRQKQLYLSEIKKDVTYFNRSYRRADLHADVAGLGVEASAQLIEGLVKERGG
jgi:shikimate kinase